MNSKSKILITGVAGFIGHHLAKLLSTDYKVTGIDNLNDYYDVNLKLARLQDLKIGTSSIEYNKPLKGEILFNKLNLTDKEKLEELFAKEKFDYIIHLAAQAGVRYSLKNPQAYIDSNINGFLNLLEAARKHKPKHLIFASSSSVYGLNKQVPFKTSQHTDHPVSLYAATKKSNEMMAHSYAHLFNIPTTGLRFFTVYGPYGRPDMALHLFTEAILQNKELDVFNYGRMSRDFTYIDDITESIKRLLPIIPKKNNPDFDATQPNPAVSSAPYRLFNIGNNQPVALMDFIKAIEKATGKTAILKLKEMQPGDVESTYADVEDLFKYINFRPNTPLEKGVKKFVERYKIIYS